MILSKRKGNAMGRYKLPENQKRKQRIYYLTPAERDLMDAYAQKIRNKGNENE